MHVTNMQLIYCILLMFSFTILDTSNGYIENLRVNEKEPNRIILILNSNRNVLRVLEKSVPKNYSALELRQMYKNQQLLAKQQERKLKEITEFLKDKYLSTNYFYSEMNRIKQQRKLKDPLRRMVDVLEQPENYLLREKVLKCFYRFRSSLIKEKSAYDYYKPNNLVINVKLDPFNHGVYP